MNSDSNVSYDRRQIQCNVKLQNAHLWKQFHEIGTEMIITKTGRRLFPAFRIQIEDLNPLAHYCVFLEIGLKYDCRYKYGGGEKRGWIRTGSAEPQSSHRVYLHPDSPSTGAHWMSQTINFHKLKITNSAIPPELEHIVLSSMHKYQPKLIIIQTHNPNFVQWAPRTDVIFQETQFIAVTAYQNDKITKLKIDNNPFAKGFRENGQGRTKRKRVQLYQEEEEEEESTVNTTNSSNEDTVSSNTSSKSLSYSLDSESHPTKKFYSSSDEISVISSPESLPSIPSPSVSYSQQTLLSNVYPPVIYPSAPVCHSTGYTYPMNYFYPYEQTTSAYYYSQMNPEFSTSSVIPYSSFMQIPVRTVPVAYQQLNVNKPEHVLRKTTDFSIKAILES